MDNISGSFKKVVISSLLAGFSSFSLNSKADIYELFLTGSGSYDDATIELGINNDEFQRILNNKLDNIKSNKKSDRSLIDDEDFDEIDEFLENLEDLEDFE